MNKNVKWVISLVVFALLLTGAVLGYNYLKPLYSSDQLAETEKEDTSGENPAPEFSVIDIDGNVIKLSDFTGKPVIINFWASWCPPCKQEMPDFNRAYAEFGDEIEFMMINLTDGGRETISTAKAFIDNAGYSFPVYYDTTYDASDKFNVVTIPASYFIDRDGNVVAHTKGMIDYNTLKRGIDMIR